MMHSFTLRQHRPWLVPSLRQTDIRPETMDYWGGGKFKLKARPRLLGYIVGNGKD